jgi:hypothetical protein
MEFANKQENNLIVEENCAKEIVYFGCPALMRRLFSLC